MDAGTVLRWSGCPLNQKWPCSPGELTGLTPLGVDGFGLKGCALGCVGCRTRQSGDACRLQSTVSRHLRDGRKAGGPAAKLKRVLNVYLGLIRYAAQAKPKIFHILWNNKFPLFDRTLLTTYYKVLGKKLVFTAHNVNQAKRDSNDSFLNRFSLKVQYRLCNHIFVHTDKMKAELLEDFGVGESAVSVIPFGINNSLPQTAMTPAQAKQRLGIKRHEKMSFFSAGCGLIRVSNIW